MRIRDLSIGVRILVFTGIFAGIILLSLVYLAMALSESSDLSRSQTNVVSVQRSAIDTQSKLLAEQGVSAKRLNNVTELSRKFSEVRFWLADLSVSWLNESEANAELAKEEMYSLLSRIDDQALAASLKDRTDVFYEKMLEAVDAYVDENRVLGNSLMSESRRQGLSIDKNLADLGKAARESTNTIATSLRDAGAQVAKSGSELTKTASVVEETSSRLLSVSLSVLLVLMIASAVYSIALKNNIHGPITKLRTALEHIEQNSDLIYRVDVDSRDEMGIMSSALNKMMEHFQGVVSQVRAAALELKHATETTGDIVGKTKVCAHKQQEATDQVAVAINEMAATVEEVARHANGASEAADEARAASDEGHQMVKETVKLMSALSENTRQAHNAISRVSDDTSNIGTVLDVIRGVSEQTNLLALNAAIEAARAGEAGRGFAVVADEVRTLAQRTQESAQEIHTMISRLQEGTANAVEVMEGGVESAEQAVQQANAAGEALQKINTSVLGIVDINIQIATATEEQSATAEEINRNITNITEYAAETADGASKTTQACTDQIALSEELASLVNKFKV